MISDFGCAFIDAILFGRGGGGMANLTGTPVETEIDESRPRVPGGNRLAVSQDVDPTPIGLIDALKSAMQGAGEGILKVE